MLDIQWATYTPSVNLPPFFSLFSFLLLCAFNCIPETNKDLCIRVELNCLILPVVMTTRILGKAFFHLSSKVPLKLCFFKCLFCFKYDIRCVRGCSSVTCLDLHVSLDEHDICSNCFVLFLFSWEIRDNQDKTLSY